MKLALKSEFTSRNIDVSMAPWNALGDVSSAELLDWPANVDRRKKCFREIFDVTEQGNENRPSQLVLSGNLSNVHGLGRGLSGGIIVIASQAGNRIGESMAGGTIIIDGDCGTDVGRGMTGGRIWIQGNAGHYLGGVMPGAKSGMNGGEIFVLGDAGDCVGEAMRRGIIVVAGNTGECTARDMKAGTIVLGHPPSTPMGLGLRRGTILVYNSEEEFTPGLAFAKSSKDSPVFLSLIQKQLLEAGLLQNAPLNLEYTRYCGDRLELNRGEIFASTRSLDFTKDVPTIA